MTIRNIKLLKENNKSMICIRFFKTIVIIELTELQNEQFKG